MKFQKQYIPLIFGIVVLMAAALAVVPAWVGTLIAANRASTRELAKARQDVGVLLQHLDEEFAANHGDHDDDWDDWALEVELENILHRYPQILTFFCDETLCEETKIRDVRKLTVLEALGTDGYQDLQLKVEEIVGDLQSPRANQAPAGRTFELGGRSYSVVLRIMAARTQELTNISICGFVVDHQLAGAAQEGARDWNRMVWILVSTASVCLLCLFAVTVGVLLLFLHKAHRDAAERTTFVSNVSHELRTPLTSILSYAEMLAEGRCRTEEMRAKALEKIIRQGRRLDRMVAELLDFSRLERRVRRYQMFEVDLGGLVYDTVGGLQTAFAEHGISVSSPEHLVVKTDADTLRQILENLLTNAAKYAAKDGPVEVLVVEQGGEVEIQVADRGPGMSAAQMKKAFDAFWRADNSKTRTTGGYGIGLAVARGHARGMGGDLVVAAREGGGCVFTLKLKVKEA